MRIAGGIYGGRVVLVPRSSAVRPTQEKVRQALFSMLRDDVASARFLDLFAGSGAVGLEAVSRGAAAAVLVERDGRHVETIRKNIAALGAQAASVVRADAYRYVASYSGEGFDIAFADPPYLLGEEKGYGELLDLLAGRGVVKPGGVFCAETALRQKAEEPPGWTLVRDREYGKTRLAVWRRNVQCRDFGPTGRIPPLQDESPLV